MNSMGAAVTDREKNKIKRECNNRIGIPPYMYILRVLVLGDKGQRYMLKGL